MNIASDETLKPDHWTREQVSRGEQTKVEMIEIAEFWAVNTQWAHSKKRSNRITRTGIRDEWMTGSRSFVRKLFHNTGAWYVNDLSEI